MRTYCNYSNYETPLPVFTGIGSTVITVITKPHCNSDPGSVTQYTTQKWIRMGIANMVHDGRILINDVANRKVLLLIGDPFLFKGLNR